MSPLIAATPAYADMLAAIHARAFPSGERWGADAIALQLGLPGAFGWVAPAGGFVLARAAADQAEILTLAVDPALQRHGLGRTLLGCAIEEAGRHGAAVLFLEVAESNGPARALYACCGFAEVGRRRRYYAAGVDALVLRASIPCGSRGG